MFHYEVLSDDVTNSDGHFCLLNALAAFTSPLLNLRSTLFVFHLRLFVSIRVVDHHLVKPCFQNQAADLPFSICSVRVVSVSFTSKVVTPVCKGMESPYFASVSLHGSTGHVSHLAGSPNLVPKKLLTLFQTRVQVYANGWSFIASSRSAPPRASSFTPPSPSTGPSLPGCSGERFWGCPGFLGRPPSSAQVHGCK